MRERSWCKFDAAFDAEQTDAWFDVARLERVLSDNAALPSVDIYADGHLKRLTDMQKKSGHSALDVATCCFREGQTVRLRDADHYDRHLSDLIAAVKRVFVGATQANIYLTPPRSDGFPPHFDITDVFVVQLSGAKRWTIFPDYTNRIELPLPSTDWDPERYTPTDDFTAFELTPGDVLYLPRGAMHSAACTERESMHLTISLAPATLYDLLTRALAQAADADVALRKRVAATGPDAPTAEEIRSRLVAALDEVDLTPILATMEADREDDVGGWLAEAIADVRSGLSRPS
ncbi:MAG: cupin domain-containing protein [Gammaproteobacteria bacterium]|nr:cupin domain-containing protein [Gammaproteobacteria bacterium]